MAKVQDYGLKVNEFEFQFWTNNLKKGMNSLIPPPVID